MRLIIEPRFLGDYAQDGRSAVANSVALILPDIHQDEGGESRQLWRREGRKPASSPRDAHGDAFIFPKKRRLQQSQEAWRPARPVRPKNKAPFVFGLRSSSKVKCRRPFPWRGGTISIPFFRRSKCGRANYVVNHILFVSHFLFRGDDRDFRPARSAATAGRHGQWPRSSNRKHERNA